MIATVSGKISAVKTDTLVLDVQGIGFEISVPKPLLAEVEKGEFLLLYTHLVVRQDLMALFGFRTEEEKHFFNLLLGVEGIGPKLAMSILSHLSLDIIRSAIVSENPDIFSRVPGVGRKTAQKILIHMQGKISPEGFETGIRAGSADEDVLDALIGLGYSVVEAQSALQAMPKDTPDTLEDKLRLALQYFRH